MPVGRPWPASLPQDFSQNNYQGDRTPVRIESDTDSGFIRRRRRFTQPTRSYRNSMLMDDAQLTTFYSFYDDDTKGGSLDFDWKDPRTQQAAVVAFVGEEPIDVANGADFRVTFAVRVVSYEP